MNLHSLLNRHTADLKGSGWKGGRFVTACLVCGREMVKPPGGEWQLSGKG